jgi:hypothetical protein
MRKFYFLGQLFLGLITHGESKCESISESSGHYEANISGKDKIFHRSKGEPSDEELEFHLKNYLNSPLNKIGLFFGL